MPYQPTIVVDFDGTIVEHRYPEIGPIKDGAREALDLFRNLGYRIVISSCRTSTWYDDEFHVIPGCPMSRQTVLDMVNFLVAHNIAFDEIDDGTKGKPFGRFYLDDSAIRVQNNRAQIAAAIGGLGEAK